MDLRWVEETVSAEKRVMVNMVLAFKRRLSRQFSNPYDEAPFQYKLYKNIDPETAKAIIAATHRPYRSMQKISTLVNRRPIYYW